MNTIHTLLAKVEKMQFPPSLKTERIKGAKKRKSFVRLSEEIKIYARLLLKEGKLTTAQCENLSQCREELAWACLQLNKQQQYFNLLTKVADEILVELAKTSPNSN